MSSVRKSIKLILSLLLLTLPLQANAQTGSDAKLLRFDPAVVNLGELPASQDSVSVTFDFTNISEGDVHLVEVHSQCSCTKPYYSSKTVRSGKKSSLKVTLYLKDLTGPQKRYLTAVATDGQKRRFSTITIVCNVVR